MLLKLFRFDFMPLYFSVNTGGGLEDQITLVLVKKGVIDCENETQCADDRSCLDSIEPETRGRKLCEKVCHEYRYI